MAICQYNFTYNYTYYLFLYHTIPYEPPFERRKSPENPFYFVLNSLTQRRNRFTFTTLQPSLISKTSISGMALNPLKIRDEVYTPTQLPYHNVQ
jgi:hypothetical protein